MKNVLLVFVLIGLFTSCGNPKPRKPITRTGNYDMSESVKFNKKLLLHENKMFQNIMEADSLHTYHDSHYGFWYTYLTQNKQDTLKPIKGDKVTFLYDIKSIDGKSIYTKEDLGKKEYLVDQQDFMQGIQEGKKMMKVNEKVIFLLPSQKAYAYYGDEKKIGSNTPLIVTVELLDIQNN
jgi:gliding motility-associated peptidyl-prolyl isomerase